MAGKVIMGFLKPDRYIWLQAEAQQKKPGGPGYILTYNKTSIKNRLIKMPEFFVTPPFQLFYFLIN